MNESGREVFLGRLGKEPELRYTKNSKPVCYLSVATSDLVEQKTVWNKVVVWGKQAELCNVYLKKGKEVFIQGHREIKEFVTNEGENKRFEQINASLVGFSNL